MTGNAQETFPLIPPESMTTAAIEREIRYRDRTGDGDHAVYLRRYLVCRRRYGDDERHWPSDLCQRGEL